MNPSDSASVYSQNNSFNRYKVSLIIYLKDTNKSRDWKIIHNEWSPEPSTVDSRRQAGHQNWGLWERKKSRFIAQPDPRKSDYMDLYKGLYKMFFIIFLYLFWIAAPFQFRLAVVASRCLWRQNLTVNIWPQFTALFWQLA